MNEKSLEDLAKALHKASKEIEQQFCDYDVDTWETDSQEERERYIEIAKSVISNLVKFG